MITIAASKGVMLDPTLDLLDKIGIQFSADTLKDRKLSMIDTQKQVRLLQIRPWDVGVYVANGAADIGVMGYDVIVEKQEAVSQLLDLKYGKCRLVVAGLSDQPYAHNMTIATKYPRSTEAYFAKQGIKIRLVKLYGAIELAPIVGLSDLVCDLAASGKTLKENGLKVMDTLYESSARLVANPVSLKRHYATICEITDQLSKIVTR